MLDLRAVIRMHGNHRLDLQPQRSLCPVGRDLRQRRCGQDACISWHQSLYRGVSKGMTTRCAYQQAPLVWLKLFEDNKEMIRGAGHVIESAFDQRLQHS